jgi:hypothetical protein
MQVQQEQHLKIQVYFATSQGISSLPISSRAQVFRNRLIEEFQLGEDQSSLDMQVPKITSEDFLDSKVRSKALRDSPFQLIKFKPFKRTPNGDQEVGVDRRLLRTRNKDSVPIGAWAAKVVRNMIYQKALLVLIVLNSFSVAVEVELRPQVFLILFK